MCFVSQTSCSEGLSGDQIFRCQDSSVGSCHSDPERRAWSYAKQLRPIDDQMLRPDSELRVPLVLNIGDAVGNRHGGLLRCRSKYHLTQFEGVVCRLRGASGSPAPGSFPPDGGWTKRPPAPSRWRDGLRLTCIQHRRLTPHRRGSASPAGRRQAGYPMRYCRPISTQPFALSEGSDSGA